MAYGPLKIPSGFLDLTHVQEGGFDKQINAIGVVVDHVEAAKSRGTDYTIKFTLHDNAYTTGIGLPVRFFQKQESHLPRVQNNGDVVILRNVKLKLYGGDITLLSNSSSSWVVLEYASLNDCTDPTKADITMHQSGRPNHPAAKPSDAELQYAKAILALEDPTRWQQPPKSTALQIAEIQRSNGGNPTQPASLDRFTTISSLRPPAHKNEKIYIDLFAEVRRIFSPENGMSRLELSVTDYTEHPKLYNYAPDGEYSTAGFDGDRFGYIQNTHKLWPGPWGKMTMLVILWPPHKEYAISNVSPGSFVYLKKVHVKLDKDGSKLEGHMHTDNFYENRINVSVFKAREADGDGRLKTLLQRKRGYEEYCRKNQLRFIRDARPKESDPKRKEAPDPEEDSTTKLTSKQKRNRDNKRRRKAKAAAKDLTKTDKQSTDSDTEVVNAPSTNTYVRTVNNDCKLTLISDILDPSALLRKTPIGNDFHLPFQNCVYKSKVRVVDFYPDHLEDFAVPVRENQYAALDSDEESEESGSDIDMIDADSATDGVTWQWRFILLIEDSSSHKAGSVSHQMELLVSDSDGEYLLNDVEACNLRKAPKALTRLREKLFVLWGDLEERKREHEQELENERGRALLQGETGVEEMGREWGSRLKASARPFECFIKEYGVRVQKPVKGRIVDEGEKKGEWERIWRMCYTCV